MPRGIPVINLNTGQYFNSALEASRYFSIDNSDIGKACKVWRNTLHKKIKKRNAVGRYKWMYYEDYLNLYVNMEIDLTLSNQGRKLINLVDGKIYRSVSHFASEYKLDRKLVSKLLNRDGLIEIEGYTIIYLDVKLSEMVRNNSIFLR